LLVVRADKDGLAVRFRPGQEYPLAETYKDGFKSSTPDCDLHYVRDTKNSIVAMVFSFSDARDIAFKKIK